MMPVSRSASYVVNVHDFPGDALGRAVPYGVYDVTHNRGLIYLGTSGDTAAFAADAIAAWWQTEGRATWSNRDHFLLLADAGGSNSCRTRAWKERLQVQVCDRFGLTVTVCHYPTGCSKWNPIERSLFSQISRNWAGVPLRTWDTVLGFIRGTKTSRGLAVTAVLHRVTIQPVRRLRTPRWPRSTSSTTPFARPGTIRFGRGLCLPAN